MTEAFVARQPIFDRQMRVYGYELLYRAEPEDQWAAIQDAGEAATSTVLVNWATGVGMEQLTGGRMAFVNVSRAFLFDLEHVAPAPFTVALEIPAVVQNEPELVSVVQELASAGYSIALDDFQLDTVTPELLEGRELVLMHPLPRVDEISPEDLIPEERTVVTLTEQGMIKRMKSSMYRTQKRGGKGVIGAKTKEEDKVEHLLFANSHDYLYFFTDSGKVFRSRAYDIPAAKRTA